MRHPLALTYIDYEQRAASDVDDPGGRSTFLFEGNLDAVVRRPRLLQLPRSADQCAGTERILTSL
jgi:hypothetical protein